MSLNLDIIDGRLVAIVPESIYLSDLIGLKTGSGGCVSDKDDRR